MYRCTRARLRVLYIYIIILYSLFRIVVVVITGPNPYIILVVACWSATAHPGGPRLPVYCYRPNHRLTTLYSTHTHTRTNTHYIDSVLRSVGSGGGCVSDCSGGLNVKLIIKSVLSPQSSPSLKPHQGFGRTLLYNNNCCDIIPTQYPQTHYIITQTQDRRRRRSIPTEDYNNI